MRNLQERGSYLNDQANLNKNISYVLFSVAAIGIVISFILINFYLIIPSIISLVVGGYFFNLSIPYDKGIEGEKITEEHLQQLPDSYSLINDVNLEDSFGNIDHIVLGQNGIFVIETKNHEGKIRYEGDNWFQFKEEWKIPEEHEMKSPSKQVKRNAAILRNYISENDIFKNSKRLWVEGIVVFTHNNVRIKGKNSTVPILKVHDLPNYIRNKRSNDNFSHQDLDKLAEILMR